MYPYDLLPGLLPGLDLYSLCITVGVVVCLLLLRLQGDWLGLRAREQNFILMAVPVSVVLGYGSAVLFQAFYNMMDGGDFELTSSTGATFFGGLIGGTAVFILLYFFVGPIRLGEARRAEFRRRFRDVLRLAPAAITVAHGCGRLGCLFAGCCHGRVTEAWYGVTLASGVRVVPIPLFEALFLLALCGVLLVLTKKGFRHQMPVYMWVYGTWRFFIEYARDDDRGATVVDFLTPSQLVALLLIVGGVVLFVCERRYDRRIAIGKGSALHE